MHGRRAVGVAVVFLARGAETLCVGAFALVLIVWELCPPTAVRVDESGLPPSSMGFAELQSCRSAGPALLPSWSSAPFRNGLPACLFIATAAGRGGGEDGAAAVRRYVV